MSACCVSAVEQRPVTRADGADLYVAAAAHQPGRSQLLVDPAGAAHARAAHAARLRLLSRQAVSVKVMRVTHTRINCVLLAGKM